MDTLNRTASLCLTSLACVAIGLTGCSTITPIHDYCQIAKPIYLQKGEAAKLSDESAKAILAHDETWAKICKH